MKAFWEQEMILIFFDEIFYDFVTKKISITSEFLYILRIV